MASSGSAFAWLMRSLRHDVRLPVTLPQQSARLAALIEALDSAAAAVSAAPDVRGALCAVAEQARRFTKSEKVVLCLHGAAADEGLPDEDDFVVRGRRHEHPQEWWAAEIPSLSGEALEQRAPVARTLGPARAWLLAVPVRSHDEPLGVLVAINSVGHKLTAEHTAFLSVLGTFAAASILNARLAERSRYALLASERERIAREMHDGIAQSLFSISLGIDLCRRTLARNPDLVAHRLEEIQAQLHESMSEVRRYIYDLRPARLRDLGLTEAIRYWVRETVGGFGPEIEIAEAGPPARLPGDVEACLYHIGREALSNALRHANAHRIALVVEYGPGAVTLTVTDDGDGFSPLQAEQAERPGTTHGLHTMRERAEALGGTVRIDARPNGGCTVRAFVPVSAEAGA
ncbi:MAG: GAF domain-containing sensor histidine kinase [Coriobacteriia bacterium]|nr:GAF domain-containing sensor histidine kinase [Coriobacteriia bacterium]